MELLSDYKTNIDLDGENLPSISFSVMFFLKMRFETLKQLKKKNEFFHCHNVIGKTVTISY